MKTLKTCIAAAAMLALTTTAHAALASQGEGRANDTDTHRISLQDWSVNGLANSSMLEPWGAGSNYWEMTAQFILVSPVGYWASTESLGDGRWAWEYVPPDGLPSGVSFQIGGMDTVAVRPVDVSASVPEPHTLALALLALGAMVVARNRRAH